jgi:O-methyltransferase
MPEVQSFRLVRKVLPKKMHPFLRGVRKRIQRWSVRYAEPYHSVFPYTQAHIIRQENLVRLALEIERNNVSGAIVECGVLDGGTAALMALYTRNREVHLFDSWEGLPASSNEDDEHDAMWAGQDVGSPRRVLSVMGKLGIDRARLHFHKGWFSETFPKADIDTISLLHVDGDFYESVALTLKTWAPKVSQGGYIQIDDYSAFVGCKKAVDEFLVENPSLRLEKTGTHTQAFYICKV